MLLSAKVLASACSDATKQAKRMRRAFQNSQELVHTTRKKVILESQNLVRKLGGSGGDSMQQLKLMNKMLQETQLQLLDEKACSDKTLQEACNPELLGLTKQNALASEFSEKIQRAETFLVRCTAEIIKRTNKNSIQMSTTDQHYAGEVSLHNRVMELKRLRAEVVRLRHTMHAYEITESLEEKKASTPRGTGKHVMRHYASYERESADAQVICELKGQVLALKEKLRSSTPYRDVEMRGSAQKVFGDFTLELERLRQFEHAHVSLLAFLLVYLHVVSFAGSVVSS